MSTQNRNKTLISTQVFNETVNFSDFTRSKLRQIHIKVLQATNGFRRQQPN